ncbi:MAG: hypothetical protein ACK5MZ_11455 [Aestuariibaculum sp.]
MKKLFANAILLAVIFLSCNSKPKPFDISKHYIGALTDSTQIKDLKTIFGNDSLVDFNSGKEFEGVSNKIEVYEKGGKKLLVLTPGQFLDSTSVITNVQIIDQRFKTDKGISTQSSFKDINTNYTIKRIDNLINAIAITVNEINASFIIDKEELPANLRFDRNIKFEATHIPDNAKLKYFFINWE